MNQKSPAGNVHITQFVQANGVPFTLRGADYNAGKIGHGIGCATVEYPLSFVVTLLTLRRTNIKLALYSSCCPDDTKKRIVPVGHSIHSGLQKELPMTQAAVEIFVILLLIGLNGLFAMAEIAVVSARRVRLDSMAREGSAGARVAIELIEAPNRFLSTVQVGITLVGIFAGAFGGATVAQNLAELLRQIPLLASYAGAISLAAVVGTITFLSVVVGELVPKRIALQNAERIAAFVARPMHVLSWLATPVVRLLSISTDALLTILGLEAQPQTAVTEEEIKGLVEQGAKAGMIHEAEREMVESVFRLDDRPLESMMTPRPEIVWLDLNESPEVTRRLVEQSNFSRFPVCEDDLDHVVGIVHTKDLLGDCLGDHAFDVGSAMREPLFVPESVHALTALDRFKTTGIHMALLIDEYGGIEGLVTLIDILEAIVGDIPTLEELVEPPIVEREDGSWLVDGLLPVEELKRHFQLESLPSEGSFQTLGGFMVLMLGSVPATGDHFEWGNLRFEVADMDGHRIDKVLVEPSPAGAGEAE